MLRLLLALVVLLHALPLSAGESSTVWWKIVDDDDPTTISAGLLRLRPAASASQPNVDEGDTGSRDVAFVVSRVGGNSGAITVQVTVSSVNATPGTDFLGSTSILSWPAGDTSDRTFIITVLADNEVEGGESISLRLESPSGGAVIDTDQYYSAVHILDDDGSGTAPAPPAGRIAFLRQSLACTEGGTAQLEVVRAGGTQGAVSVTWAVNTGVSTASAGTDYVASGGMLTWGDGDAANKAISIPLPQDAVWEAGEDLHLALSSPTNGSELGQLAACNVYIIDDDPLATIAAGVLSFNATTTVVVSEGNGPSHSASVEVRRLGGTTGAITCAWRTGAGSNASPGTDYATDSGTLTWSDGDATPQQIALTILGDTQWEPLEWFTLTLDAPTGGATITAWPLLDLLMPGDTVITKPVDVACTAWTGPVSGSARSMVATGLPPGLTFSGINYGEFSGTPTTVGTWPVTVTAFNELGSDSQVITFVISAGGGAPSPADGGGSGGCGAGGLASLLMAAGLAGLRRRRRS